MTHLEIEHLASDYLEGQLDPASRAAVDLHLAECRECRAMIEEVGRAIEMCRSAEEVAPPPWLVPKILRATIGERPPTLGERLGALLRPAREPRFVSALAMVVFAFSIIINAAGVNLRDLSLADLNPRTWFYKANQEGHLVVARAQKFYYDLRVVYEIESRFRQLRSQPAGEEKTTPQPSAPPGGTTDRSRPGDPQLAWAENPKASHNSTAVIGRSSAP